MPEVKCKACGGPVAFEPGAAEGVCRRCGAKQALPKEPDTDGLLRQAFLLLEDRDWQSAGECCEIVLRRDPENALAYFGRLMAELHASPGDDLSEQKEPFDMRPSCQQALRYGDEALRDELESANAAIRARLEAERREQELVRREQEVARREQEVARREREAAEAAEKPAESGTPSAPVKPKKKALPLILALAAVLLIGGGLLIWRMSGSGQGQVRSAKPDEPQEQTSTADSNTFAVGDFILFGKYEQDNDTSNGKEDIEWLVLAKEGGRVLVISKYAIDCQPYNSTSTSVTWESCTLRKWLNDSFLNAAFSAEEQAMIPTVTVSADRNPDYSTDPGNATRDQVFLLSIAEVNQFFTTDKARSCAPTAYAIAQGAYTNDAYKVDGKAACWWWLRSPGRNSSLAASVNYVGSVYSNGHYVSLDYDAVRPALWIDLG